MLFRFLLGICVLRLFHKLAFFCFLLKKNKNDRHPLPPRGRDALDDVIGGIHGNVYT
jgi:hypothetical protein